MFDRFSEGFGEGLKGKKTYILAFLSASLTLVNAFYPLSWYEHAMALMGSGAVGSVYHKLSRMSGL